MNKKVLLCLASVMLVMLLAASSLFIVSAASDTNLSKSEETSATFETGYTGSTEATEATTEAQTPQKLVGDVDGSGVIDINDATEYQLILAGRASATDAFALNSNTVTDSKRNIIDVTGIQYYVANVFKKLPVTLDGYYSEIIRP